MTWMDLLTCSSSSYCSYKFPLFRDRNSLFPTLTNWLSLFLLSISLSSVQLSHGLLSFTFPFHLSDKREKKTNNQMSFILFLSSFLSIYFLLSCFVSLVGPSSLPTLIKCYVLTLTHKLLYYSHLLSVCSGK